MPFMNTMRPPNHRVNPTIQPVTGRAFARPAPVRPAGYAERYVY